MSERKRPEIKNFIYRFFSVLFTAGILFSQEFVVSAEKSDIEKRLEEQRASEIQTNQIPNWPFGPVVSADSAILMEANTGAILYAKDIHKREYPASTTKIMTSLLATELASLDDVITFSHDAVFDNPPGSSGIAMDVGQQLTLEQCLNAILIRSANEVCFAVAEHITGTTDWKVFAEVMNDRAKELGALNTHFVNPNGLPDENHYTTAYDLAMIGRAFFENEMLCKISLSRRMEIPASDTIPETKIENNAMQIIPGGKYAYEYLIGCKTGYTNDARSCLVSCAEKNGLRLICVVLKDESPLQYEDTISLFNYGFSNFDRVNVAQAETKYKIEGVGSFYEGNDIFGSSAPLLSLNRSDYIVLPRTLTMANLSSSISYDNLHADQAALITYSYHDTPLGSVRVNFEAEEDNSYQFEPVSEEETPDPPAKNVVFVNIIRVFVALGILAFCVLIFFIVKILRKNFTFASGKGRREWKKANRKRIRAAHRRNRNRRKKVNGL